MKAPNRSRLLHVHRQRRPLMGVVGAVCAGIVAMTAPVDQTAWAQLSLNSDAVPALSAPATSIDRPATLMDLRLGDHGNRTRLVLEVSRALDFHLFAAHDGDARHLVLDLPRIGFERFLGSRDGLGLINTIRGGPRRDGGGRMVLEVSQPVTVEDVFYIPPRDGFSNRLVIDVVPAQEADFTLLSRHTLGNPSISLGGADRTGTDIPVASQTVNLAPTLPPVEEGSEAAPLPLVPAQAPSLPQTTDPIVATAPAFPPPPAIPPRPVPAGEIDSAGGPSLPTPPAQAPSAEAIASQPGAAPGAALVITAALGPVPAPPRRPLVDWPIVVIDPGHGGDDPGAIAISGVFEKAITLAVSQRLADYLSATGRIRVHLTRDDDTFLALRERVALARGWGGDLFVSIHADSIDNAAVRGASVYTLSDVASDAEAAALARRENQVDAIAGVAIDPNDDVMTSILIDLAQQSTFRESHRFAGEVIDALNGTVPLLPNTHRQAGFAVLKAPDVPSVLVELGYLSSRHDAQMLTDSTHQDLLAERLAAAIITHFDAVGRLDLAHPQAAALPTLEGE